jgi:hypothetical protein
MPVVLVHHLAVVYSEKGQGVADKRICGRE